ncbi:hypothetical protein BH18ACT1_BH18ACT1_03860 [soil metagenome]
MRERHPNQRASASLPQELRRTTVPGGARSWVARVTGAPVARVERLPGASSTAVHRLHLADGRSAVLRRYVWPGFLEDEPVAPRREVDALRFARDRGLPAPEVLAADVDGGEVGDGVPALLMTLLPGRATAVPDLERLAEVAAAVHDVDPAGFGHEWFRWYQGRGSVRPAWTARPALWESASDVWLERTAPDPATFVHRDFHPGNVLWSRGRATGIVDWANACRGPWGVDVAHCRANLIDLDGVGAADRFLAAYEALTGRSFDPYWEIASVMEHDPQDWAPERDEPRLERALAALGR